MTISFSNWIKHLVYKFITLKLMTAKNILELLPLSFYRQKSVVKIARDLLGKILVTNFDGKLCTGRIVETEAYNRVRRQQEGSIPPVSIAIRRKQCTRKC